MIFQLTLLTIFLLLFLILKDSGESLLQELGSYETATETNFCSFSFWYETK